ncbi:MAG: GH1 family beta-glucosidase [Maritimibacter sp.]
MTLSFTRKDLPEGFLFGTATAAYQIEGSSFGNAGPSHWDTFAATPGNVENGEDGSIACDSYHRYGEDLDLLRDGNFDAYRFSTSWSRVMPEGRGKPNPEGLDYYDRLVDGMLERGLKPFATLYHWEMPAALSDLGGWTNPDVAKWFADFAEVITDRIGDRLWATATINEPWCVAWLSHFLGAHAPGLRDIRAAARAMHNVLLAHGSAMQVMRAKGMKNLGIAPNFEAIQPADDSAEAKAAAAREEALFNRWFIEAIFKGQYPEEALEGLAPHLPKGWQDDMALISQPIDWLGVNYYTRNIVAPDNTPWPALKSVEGPLNPKTEMGWEIFPEGLEQILTWIAREYSGDLPIFVTENGMAAPDRTVVDRRVVDKDRIEFFDLHIAALRRAIAAGAPVQGYFAWSLLDNFEWALGYDKRFGIVQVDFETLERHPKASYHALKTALSRS